MYNRKDILEATSPLQLAIILAVVFGLGWLFGAILIAEDCEWNQHFTVLGDVFTCFKVGAVK